MDDVLMAQVEKIDDLEDDVERAFMTGTVQGKELTSAQLVTLLSERRRLVELRSVLLGFIKPPEESENGH